MCRVHNKMRIRWDLVIMFLAIWNCINVPYSLAFDPDNDDSTLFVLNVIIDTLFAMDIVINFRTSYINEETGVETFSCSKIALQY